MSNGAAEWVPALVIGGETTPQQRQRNFALYQRLRDGAIGVRGGAGGLSGFVYDVPIERLSLAPGAASFSFRLAKDDECFRRLLSVVTDHFPSECEVDDENAKLREQVACLQARVNDLESAAR